MYSLRRIKVIGITIAAMLIAGLAAQFVAMALTSLFHLDRDTITLAMLACFVTVLLVGGWAFDRYAGNTWR